MDGAALPPFQLFGLRWPSVGVHRFSVGLMATCKRTYTNTRLPGLCCRCSSPRGGPLWTHASTGDPQTLTARSGSVSCGVTAPFPGSWYTRGFACALERGVCLPQSCGSLSPLSLDVGYLFLGGSNILLLMVVQQLVAILMSSQEKMSTFPSTRPSWSSLCSFVSRILSSYCLFLLSYF